MPDNTAAYFRSWADFESRLDSLGLFSMKPGLERISAALRALGLVRPPFPVAQVVGTNGKGSTVSYMASIAREHGLTAGVHTSPHFVSVRERVRIFRPGSAPASSAPASYAPAGSLLPESAWLDAANRVMAAGGEDLSYFELVTAVALELMRSEGVDLAVMETGLGGLFDATTALDADLVAFTPFAMDHMHVLGPTLGHISRDKAGAMRRGKPALSAVQMPEAQTALQNEAQKKHSTLRFCPPEGLLPDDFLTGRVKLGLDGEHQKQNAALALAAWRELGLGGNLPAESREKAEHNGLARAFLPGRMQFVDPLTGPKAHPPLILDGGHNRHGLAALGHSLAIKGVAPAAVIFTCMEDKEPEALVPHLRALSTGPVFVPGMPGHPRAMKPDALAQMIGLAAEPCRDLAEALAKAAELVRERLPECMTQKAAQCAHPLLICGSLYLLGEFFAMFPQYMMQDD